jgi:hypothetical protein
LRQGSRQRPGAWFAARDPGLLCLTRHVIMAGGWDGRPGGGPVRFLAWRHRWTSRSHWRLASCADTRTSHRVLDHFIRAITLPRFPVSIASRSFAFPPFVRPRRCDLLLLPFFRVVLLLSLLLFLFLLLSPDLLLVGALGLCCCWPTHHSWTPLLGCPDRFPGRSRKSGPARSGGPLFLESPGVERKSGRWVGQQPVLLRR